MTSSSEYQFVLGYFSEVSARITVRSTGGLLTAEATHVTDDVGIDCWFHFCDKTVSEDEIVVRATDGIGELLYNLAVELHDGMKSVVEVWEDDSSLEAFVSDMFVAFIFGTWYPSPKTDDRLRSLSVGEAITERFK